ncbi:MAG: hypothetical protein EBQ92_03705 [Proteobacteria bacterium]|nr:hypothetical protein [Pseudomonadota bacterium]
MRFDRNHDFRPDAIYFFRKNEEKVWFSLWDTNYDGVWDLAGHHPNGAFTASRYEDYKSFKGE